MAQGSGGGASPQRVQGGALAAAEPGAGAAPLPPERERMAAGSKEGGLYLGAVAGGVGEHKASAETECKAGGFQGVAARCHVVHKVGLAERQGFAGAGQVVLVGRDGAKRQLVAGALGLNGLGAVDGFDDLSARAVHGNHAGQPGVGVGVAGAVGYRHQPARAGDERGHFAGGGVEVRARAGGGFDGVGQAADLGLLTGKLAVSLAGVFSGGKYVHGVWPAPLRQSGEGGRWGQSSSGSMTVMAGAGSSMSRGPHMATSLTSRGRWLSLRT